MTLDDFLRTFPAALRQLEAELLTETPHIWPRGPFLRFKATPEPWRQVPPLLDVLGVVATAQARHAAEVHGAGPSLRPWYGVVDWPAAVHALGLARGDGLAIAETSDATMDQLARKYHPDHALVRLREQLEWVVEEVFPNTRTRG